MVSLEAFKAMIKETAKKVRKTKPATDTQPPEVTVSESSSSGCTNCGNNGRTCKVCGFTKQ